MIWCLIEIWFKLLVCCMFVLLLFVSDFAPLVVLSYGHNKLRSTTPPFAIGVGSSCILTRSGDPVFSGCEYPPIFASPFPIKRGK